MGLIGDGGGVFGGIFGEKGRGLREEVGIRGVYGEG